MASVVAELRRLVPLRRLTLGEALRVAELQANRLLASLGIEDAPVPETVVSKLPRFQVRRQASIPVSGAANWAKGKWMIVLNASEPSGRQRFSLCHELKHVLDAPFDGLLYGPKDDDAAHERSEQIADYFAACLLMPRMWVKRAYRNGVQDVAKLAGLFAVSRAAMNVRLQNVGLIEPPKRCRGRIAAWKTS